MTIKKARKSLNTIDYDEFYYHYITLNLSTTETAKALNISYASVTRFVKHHNIRKTKAAILEKHKQTFTKIYGVDNPSKCEAIKRQKEETCLKNYGTKYSFQNEECRKKTEKTLKEMYGEDIINVGQATVIKKRIKATKKEKYGDENYVNSEKAKQTCLERYGVEHTSQLDTTKEKAKQTIKERYGVENLMEIKEHRIKCIENTKKSNLAKYGVENTSSLPEIQEKLRQAWKKKSKQELNKIVDKRIKTQKANGTINTSKPEEEIYSLLTLKFNDVKRQYKSELYPFHCDFYIPEIDLYIEYQGYWTHGSNPFNVNDLKDQERLKKLTERKYLYAVRIWTESDPNKRETAKKNNLNWIEFFNMNQFMDWYNRV